jgi:hypothetical protein
MSPLVSEDERCNTTDDTTVNVVTVVAAPQTTPRSARRETGLGAYGFCGVAIGSGTFS